jgi:hypothetical protein
MPHIRELLHALMQGQLIAPKIDIDPTPLFPIAERTPQNIRIKRHGFAELSGRDSKV